MATRGVPQLSVDVVVLTAITLEYQAVLRVDTGACQGSRWVEEQGPNGLPVAFREFKTREGQRPLRVAVAQAGDMGAGAATNALLPLVERYGPRCVAMCGVCAGRPGKTNLGDVIAAERLFFHDTGKRLPDQVQQDPKTYNLRDDWKIALDSFDFATRFQEQEWWRQRPIPYEWQENWVLAKLNAGVTDLVSDSEFERFCPRWEQVIESLWMSGAVQDGELLLTEEGRKKIGRVLVKHRNGLPDLSPSGSLLPFKVHVAPMGSGSQVVEDARVWSYVSEHMRKALGLEMEAAALGALAHAQRDHRLDALVMKGVMDFANHGRDDQFKEYAARASAECLLAFLREKMDVGIPKHRSDSKRALEEWAPWFAHALQPANHFQGREELVVELKNWCQESVVTEKIISLIAAGGTGKTALAEQIIRGLKTQKRPGGVFVWSFYEAASSAQFLGSACEYFCDESDKDSKLAGQLERLQRALSDERPHLLVLDGLERVQVEANANRGAVEEHQLKLFLRALADGLGNTRALVTSRFPLIDLQNWEGQGYSPRLLDDLDPRSARGLLHAWGVQGSDASLEKLARQVGYHALSLSVLGSYLGNFCGGDPTAAFQFKLDDASLADKKAAKLARILKAYLNVIDDSECDLLVRLSTFSEGISMEFLQFIADAPKEVAGALSGMNGSRIAVIGERLRRLGLIYIYGEGTRKTYSAHPFLRDYFREQLEVKTEQIHEAIRVRLAPSLEEKPSSYPVHAEILDRYERLIQHSAAAGRVGDAIRLYFQGLGGYTHLGLDLGDYGRGVRILRGFSSDGTPRKMGGLGLTAVGTRTYELLLHWGLFAKGLGDLETAEQCFIAGREDESQWGVIDSKRWSEHLAEIYLLQGRLRRARQYALDAHDINNNRTYIQKNRPDFVAAALHGLGEMNQANEHYNSAILLGSLHLTAFSTLRYAEFLLDVKPREIAARQVRQLLQLAEHHDGSYMAHCYILRGHLNIPTDLPRARSYLDKARAWSDRTGDIDIVARSHELASCISLHEGDSKTAMVEANQGVRVADGCGMGIHSIKLRLALALACLDAAKPTHARDAALSALTRARHADCGYARGEADALHVLGIAHRRLGDIANAKNCFKTAEQTRMRIGHLGLEETRTELRRLERQSG
ncbi:NACHT domain-containing protein [Cystobacter fuscus]|uniref:NACHT domain-containing protein n=1 Tax=Cystobacter fuscus TaxID=43 RepID=UPI002B311ECD|nr:NACHT domain-containing protein [Cystobacter fuscus]